MEDDYFSVEAILSENQKLQCTFKHEIPNMGHLGGGAERDIAVLSKLPIPIWLAYIFIYSDWADFTIPPAFNSKVKNALKAEATSVRIGHLVGAGGTWYGFGKKIMDMLSDEQANDLSEVLTKTFRARLVEIIDQAHHFASVGQSSSGVADSESARLFREGLDVTERELFTLAHDSAKRTKQWYENVNAKK
ncbi:hypothetical protein BDQ17DRAFT_1343257 [Cyathus striatus]|nr:hypothetical protein BDQ17DRAFT_1343257 [Cyathus striatus]